MPIGCLSFVTVAFFEFFFSGGHSIGSQLDLLVIIQDIQEGNGDGWVYLSNSLEKVHIFAIGLNFTLAWGIGK